MKKLNLLLSILIGLTILSCTSDDDNDSPQTSMSELLTQNSPWTFNHFEMINIIDSGNSNFTQQDIETNINQEVNGQTVGFNSDGTGYTTIQGNVESNWEWEIVNGNQLKIIFDLANNETEVYENFSVSSTELVLDYQAVSYDENAMYEVLHYGKYFYD